MSQSPVYLYEFLWRGRAPGSAQAPDYHVILAQDVTDAFGNTSTSTSAAMTPGQAKAQGFDLPKVCADIDAGLVRANADLTTTNADLTTQVAALQGEVDGLRTAEATSPQEPAESPAS